MEMDKNEWALDLQEKRTSLKKLTRFKKAPKVSYPEISMVKVKTKC